MAASSTRRLAFAGLQTARVAFYGAHYLAARLAAQLTSFSSVQQADHPMPSLAAMLRAMGDLFAQDWKNVEAGLYPAPLNILREIRRATASVNYLRDIPKVVKRQQRHGHSEAMAKGEGKPRYYRQNFHYQTDGYLSDRSAGIYDFQVEALFAGTAEAMRRRVYVPIASYLETRDPAKTTLLDIGAGTGRFLSFVKSVQPELNVTALDLSAPYLARAKKALKGAGTFLEAAAEAMPLKDCQRRYRDQHLSLPDELPPKENPRRRQGNHARVLKPGGISSLLADTIQYGDAPDFDGLIDIFPSLLHEPYYNSYAKTDIAKLFGALNHTGDDIAYLTKISTFQKPGKTSRR